MQNTDVEIRKTCTDLELIYRCSNECRSDSFDNIGHKVVPMLIKITKMALGGQIKHGTELILKRAVKILGYFALLENGRTAMMKQSGFLYTFVKVLQADIKIVSAPIKIDSIWMIANLAFADSLREMIYNYPHLVHSLVKNMEHSNKEINCEIAATLMNLSASAANRVSMANDRETLKKLCLLVTEDGDARARAIGALKNIASAAENRATLCSFNKGLILDLLTYAMVDLKDFKSAARASGSMKYLVTAENALRLATHDSFNNTVRMIVTREVRVKSKVLQDVCFMTTAIAEGLIVTPKINSGVLNEILSYMVTISSLDNHKKKLVAETLTTLSKNPDALAIMANHQDLFNMVIDSIMSKDKRVKVLSADVILLMTQMKSVRTSIDGKSRLFFVLQSTLDVHCMQNHELSSILLKIIQNVAVEQKILRLMGRHLGFLEALVGYMRRACADDRKVLTEICTGIIQTYNPDEEGDDEAEDTDEDSKEEETAPDTDDQDKEKENLDKLSDSVEKFEEYKERIDKQVNYSIKSKLKKTFKEVAKEVKRVKKTIKEETPKTAPKDPENPVIEEEGRQPEEGVNDDDSHGNDEAAAVPEKKAAVDAPPDVAVADEVGNDLVVLLTDPNDTDNPEEISSRESDTRTKKNRYTWSPKKIRLQCSMPVRSGNMESLPILRGITSLADKHTVVGLPRLASSSRRNGVPVSQAAQTAS
mmetsp:Transcript_17343/g.39149  ORF Transcript_17343/g.39149 Transcript_17343/m.39149 type:complete len:707 (-) Transcript_17343:159-2279(-)